MVIPHVPCFGSSSRSASVTRWGLVCSVPVGQRSGEMDRAALLALDKPALIELVWALQETNAALTARVAELEARLAKLETPPKTPTNSSVPPSQARKPNRAERRPKKRGPKRGHAG